MSVSISILGIDRICESQCGLFKEVLLYLPFTFVGIGKFFAGVAMELTAVPTGGAIFYQWEDGSTDNPRLVAPTDGASYTASFK